MKILVIVRALLPYIGALEFNHPHGRLISTILLIIGFAANIFATLTTLWFFLFDATTFADRTSSLASIIMIMYIIWIYTIFVVKRKEFMAMIRTLEVKIDERMHNFEAFTFFFKRKVDIYLFDDIFVHLQLLLLLLF